MYYETGGNGVTGQKRFWMGWIAGSRPETPFDVSVTGYIDAGDGPDSMTMCAVVDAPSAAGAWSLIEKYCPGSVRRFAKAVPDGWLPTSGRIVRAGSARPGTSLRWRESDLAVA